MGSNTHLIVGNVECGEVSRPAEGVEVPVLVDAIASRRKLGREGSIGDEGRGIGDVGAVLVVDLVSNAVANGEQAHVEFELESILRGIVAGTCIMAWGSTHHSMHRSFDSKSFSLQISFVTADFVPADVSHDQRLSNGEHALARDSVSDRQTLGSHTAARFRGHKTTTALGPWRLIGFRKTLKPKPLILNPNGSGSSDIRFVALWVLLEALVATDADGDLTSNQP